MCRWLNGAVLFYSSNSAWWYSVNFLDLFPFSPHYVTLHLQIQFVLLISRQGKVRLTKWYSPYSQKERTKVILATVFSIFHFPNIASHLSSYYCSFSLTPAIVYMPLFNLNINLSRINYDAILLHVKFIVFLHDPSLTITSVLERFSVSSVEWFFLVLPSFVTL